MKNDKHPEGKAGDDGGPLVAFCVGHRCSALHSLAGEDGIEEMRTVVAHSPDAVLISTGYMGQCARGSVAAVARRDGSSCTTGPMVWFGGVDDTEKGTALRRWVEAGGPIRSHEAAAGIPARLAEIILGYGPPAQVHAATRAVPGTNPQRM